MAASPTENSFRAVASDCQKMKCVCRGFLVFARAGGVIPDATAQLQGSS